MQSPSTVIEQMPVLITGGAEGSVAVLNLRQYRCKKLDRGREFEQHWVPYELARILSQSPVTPLTDRLAKDRFRLIPSRLRNPVGLSQELESFDTSERMLRPGFPFAINE